MDEYDEATIFVLAECMIDVVYRMARNNYPGVADTIAQAVKVMQKDPGFLGRFEQTQKDILQGLSKEGL